MRDCSKNRAGFDRVLIAVAATFLAVSATSALAQSDTPRASAAELAIDAAIPRPQPANVPPPTADDFKLDATASVPPKQIELPRATANTSDPKPAETKPAETTATRSPGAQRFATAESIAPVPDALKSSTAPSVRKTSFSRARQRS